jgi:imidazolonepropionase
MWDVIWVNVNLATMQPDQRYGEIRDGAIAIQGDRIGWVGARSELPDLPNICANQVMDAEGHWMTPGLIDCHTHLVYAGNRSKEFELRLQGASYEEIAKQGDGIRSTVAMTRQASEAELIQVTQRRIQALQRQGATTIEIKSGYGLNVDTELKLLRVARTLAQRCPISIQTTFLGAHALPPEFEGRSDDYIALVCEEMLPAIASDQLADAVDAFCETIGFSPDQVRRVFQAAAQFNLPVKLHAEQLSDLAGATLAAEFNALSADHLEYASVASIEAMAAAGTVAVLLPGAFYFLRETKYPPVDLLRQYGVPIAIATDSNPGTSPTTSLLLMLNMACTLFRLTPAEALAGVTRHAARALGLTDRGVLAVGKQADLALWQIEHPAELAYAIGDNPCVGVVQQGRPVWLG